MLKQLSVAMANHSLDDVVKMDNEAYDAKFLPDEGDLLSPEPDRRVVQVIEKPVVLDCRTWEFQDLANKEEWTWDCTRSAN